MTRAIPTDSRKTLTIADLNTEIDKEPRVHDICLAGALGYARSYKIREMITRNEVELKAYGSLPLRRGQSRGQSFTEYYLNEGQALLICMFAKTVAAAEVRKALIEVFMAYRVGRIDKPVKVQAHNRRTSTKIDDALRLKQNVDRLEKVAASLQQPEPKPQNVCAMIIDGEPVWVDVNKYDGDGRAVVIEHDGRMRIQNVEREQVRLRPFGARTALGERFRSPHGGVCRNSVAVIGMLIDQNRPMAALPVMGATIDHEPMPKTRAPYKEDILRLLPTGMSIANIARKVGCSTEAVKYWRRNTAMG